MSATLLGVPLAFWSVVCFSIAAAYYFFWPQPSPKRLTPRTRGQHIVLRYFHALVWVLLGVGCLLGWFGLGDLGRWVALLAIPAYAIFLVYVVRDRNIEQADAAARRRTPDAGAPG
jgi:hypothetical protein